jgi:hypothetical protein
MGKSPLRDLESTVGDQIQRGKTPSSQARRAAMTEDGLHYYVLPKDDPVAALNILREAAGLEPWPEQGSEPK